MTWEQAAAVLALMVVTGAALAAGPDDTAGRVGAWVAILAGCVLAWVGVAAVL